jgi:hypothetical protein
MTALNCSHAILWNARGHRDVANAARARRLSAARTKRLPARHIFAATQVRLDAREGRQKSAPDFAIEQADLGRAEDRAGISGKPLLKSRECWCALHVLSEESPARRGVL